MSVTTTQTVNDSAEQVSVVETSNHSEDEYSLESGIIELNSLYLREIRKNRRLFADQNFEIETTMPELRIKALNAEQSEMYVHACVMRAVFSTLEESLRLVSTLRLLSKNNDMIDSCFPIKEASEIRKILNHLTESPSLTSNITNDSETNVSKRMYGSLLELLHSKRIQAFIKSLPVKLQSRKVLSLMAHLEHFYAAMLGTLLLSGKEVSDKRTRMREILGVCGYKRIMINALVGQMREAELDSAAKIDRINKQMRSIERKMVEMREHNKTTISYIEEMSRRVMLTEGNLSDIVIEESKAEAQQVQEHYDKIFAEHVKEEVVLRSKRFKIETKLVSTISKYDVVMLEKQALIDEISEQKQKEFEELMELKCLYKEQNKVYTKYREAYEAEEDMRRLLIYDFMIIRAAKVIQRWWRLRLKRLRHLRKIRKAMLKLQKEERKKSFKPVSPKSKDKKSKIKKC